MTARGRSALVAVGVFVLALVAMQVPPSGSWQTTVLIAALVGVSAGVVARTERVDEEESS